VWKFCVPRSIGNYAANPRRQQPGEACACFPNGSLANVECNISLIDAAFELLHRNVAGDFNSVFHAASSNQVAYIEERVCFPDERIPKAKLLFEVCECA